jgi:SAM-dependent methyltransferase
MPISWREEYTNHYYRRLPQWLDGTTEFWNLCKSNILPGSKILEIGSGPSNRTSAFLAELGELHGVDIDPSVKANQYLVTSAVVESPTLPYADKSIDACVSNYVLEHIEDPERHLKEVERVLKPGGVYVFRAPNKWHYVSIVANLSPHWFHELVANKMRGLPKDSHAPYPTVFKLNTRKAVVRLSRATGLDVVALKMIEKEPSYGYSARFFFMAFMAYERLVNSTEHLSGLRANILGVLGKPAS